MSQVNVGQREPKIRTHEGAPARQVGALDQLRRSVLACLLWEDTFYESGKAIATRIMEGVHSVSPADAAALAIHARGEYRMRHAPLLIARELARHPRLGDNRSIVGDTIAQVIQRADELSEFVAIYNATNNDGHPGDDKPTLSHQVKRGLAKAFGKFDEYQLAKYNRMDRPVRLNTALMLCHAKPKDEAQAALWKRLLDNKLAPAETWERQLSGGGDKKEVFTDLLQRNKLGYMALLRNLRNMKQAGVDESLVFQRLAEGAAHSKALPFRFVAAARAVPSWEREIDGAMLAAMAGLPRLKGRTNILVDVSYSMIGVKISGKSDLDRLDAACALAMLVAGVAESFRVFSFSDTVVEVPPRSGMALRDAIKQSQPGNGTYLGKAVKAMNTLSGDDRLIVVTDEQSHDPVPGPKGKGYMINVAAYEKGVGYGAWTHISGFSEQVVRYIQETEALDAYSPMV